MSRPVTAAAETWRVADAMVTCPKTHDSDCTLAAIRAFFEDDHVHMALIVAPDGRLITTIERPDLAAAESSSASVTKLGSLVGRTVVPEAPLGAVTATLLRDRRRRLAVIGESGQLLGLLCLKHNGSGYCTDEGVRAHAAMTSAL